jgi:hypothetical protein
MSSSRGPAILDVAKRPTRRPPWKQLDPARLRSRAVFETLLIIGALLAHLVLLRHGVYSDGQRRYEELNELLARGIISGDKYSLIGPLFATPLWLLGHLVRDPVWWVARFNLVFFGLGLLAIYLILKDKVDRGLIRKFLIILAVVSMFPNLLTTFYGETFTAVTIGVGVLAALFGPSLFGWVTIAVGVANTPATLVGMGLATLTRVLQTGRIKYFVAIAVAGALIVAENLVRFHGLTNSRYEAGFTYPINLGILSILFSFGKGLIFFAPALFLPVRSYLQAAGEGGLKLYRAHGMWIAFIVGMVLVYGGWWDWSGDWFWGPRFFLLASLPGSLVLAARLHRPSSSLLSNLITLVALCLSAWVGINGAVFYLQALVGPCAQVHVAICPYLPQTSTLWFPLLQPHLVPGIKAYGYLGFSLVVFGYLAFPLLRTIAGQTSPTLRTIRSRFSAGGGAADTQW